jgi:EAL domain-containing protein (putative c-di-GMP-specific phosphodiesterase class I)
MTTIAEGVETEEQFQSLVDRGCSEAQGFLFSAPRPLSEIAPLIERLGYEGETRVAAE